MGDCGGDDDDTETPVLPLEVSLNRKHVTLDSAFAGLTIYSKTAGNPYPFMMWQPITQSARVYNKRLRSVFDLFYRVFSNEWLRQ